MKYTMRITLVGVFVVVICLCFFSVAPGFTGEERDEAAKAVNSAAAALAKGDKKKSDRLTMKIARDHAEVYYTMMLFKERRKKGLGIGPKAGAIVPDGIEEFIRELRAAKIAPKVLKKNKDAIVKMAYRTLAIAYLTNHEPVLPLRQTGAKSRRVWVGFARNMIKSSQELIKGAKAGNAAAMIASAKRLDNSCINCHKVFRD